MVSIICGITTNPAIFEKAMMGNASDTPILKLEIRPVTDLRIYESLVCRYPQCLDILRPVMNPLRGWMVTSALKCRNDRP